MKIAKTTPLLFYVHGYNHDPTKPEESAMGPNGCYRIWDRIFESERVPFQWYSGNLGSPLEAWIRGRLSSYSYAYKDLAPSAALKLTSLAQGRDRKRYCIAHSLGSRVVLTALEKNPRLFSKVLFLNGAETTKSAERVMRKCRDTEFYNVCVATDDVLAKAAAWASPGWFGKEKIMGRDGVSTSIVNVRQIYLDNKAVQEFYKSRFGWDLRGDNPESYGDHWYSYTWHGNWPLYRYLLGLNPS